MNGPFRVAQATTGSQSAAKTPSRTVKLSKPYADQSVSVSLSYDGTVKADFSAIANEKITLVHVGEKLIILFDNKSMLTLEPFFDSNGKPLGNVSVEVSPGRDLTGAEFAALFPVTEDQSVLPAAGTGTGNAQSSGANFSSVGVDPLSLPNPLDLLGPTELPGFTITNLLNQPFINDVPTVSANAAVLFDEDGLPGGNLAGIADLDPSSNGPTTLTGTLGFTFGQDGAGTVLLLGTGAPAGFTYSLDPTSTILTVSQLQDGVIVNVLQITLNDATSGNYTITQLNPIRHAAGGDENDQDFTFNYQVTDSNGDFVVGTLSLSVDDDTPTIDVEVTEGEGGPSQLFLNPFDESIGNDPNNTGILGTIDDVGSAPDLTGTTPFGEIKSNLPGEGQTNQLAALFNIISSPGSDGEQITTQAFSLTLTGGVNGPPVATNLTATALSGTALAGLDATERAIVLVQVSPTVVEARVVGDANVIGDEFVVLRFTVINPNDPATVQLVVHQFLPIDHGADGNNFDSSVPLLISQVGASLGLTMSATIIDNDGDPATASETVAIASNQFAAINIEDDGPVLEDSEGEELPLPQSISLALDETIGTDRYNNLPLPDGEPESANGDQANGTPDDTLATVVSAPSTDSADSAAFGKITTNPGAIASNFPVLSPDFGTDGPGPNDGFSQELSFVLTGGGATNLRVTKLDNTPLEGLTDAQRNIVLTLEDGAIVGRVVGTANDSDNFVVFRITIQNATDPSTATITVEQFLPIDHGSDATSVFDEFIPLLLTDQGSLNLQLVTTISDGDTDSIVQTDTIGLVGEGSFLTFDDDGPKVSVSVNTSFALAHDETPLVQGDANDVLLPSPITLFAPVLFKGADPQTLGLPLGFARSTTAALTIGGVDFGSDGAALANSQVFSLTLTLNGQPTNVLATDLKTTEGRAIFLFQEGPFIVGRFDVAGGTVGPTDPAAFALTINPATGIVSLAQYVSLQHPIGGASHDEPVSLSNLTSFVGTGTGAINATLTVTDGDGDKASASASIGSTITFQDDGPFVLATTNPLFRLTVDESAGNQADDVSNPIAAFAGVTDVGIDPDAPVSGQPLAYATDTNNALVFVPVFGVDGPGQPGAITYSLLLNDLDNVPGVPSGVKVSDGTATGTSVTLFEEGGIIVGRVDSGDFAGKAAFAIAINPANGQVSIVQYLSLQHPNDTNPDDEISLLSGILQARVTIKDGDNDTAQSDSDISGRIVFRDDGPTLIASRPFVANVDEDGLHTSGNPPTSTLSDSNVDANRDGEVTGTNSNVYEGDPGTLNALVNFGADGFGSFSLNATLSPQATGLFSKDAEIFIQSNGTLLEGYADNRLVFTLTVGADGSFTFTLLDQINHPTLNGAEEGGGDDSENLLDITGIDLSSYVTAKDGDGDGIPLGTGSFIIQVRDDIPVALGGTVDLGTVYEDGLTATNSDDQSVGNPETDHTEVSVIITSDQLKALVSAGADEDVTFSLNGAVGNPLGLTSHNIPVTYLVSGNTLTAKAGANTVFTIEDNLDGTFTFTLLDQLDHLPLGSGAGDDEPLTLNLAAAFKATDFDGDSVVLTGALNLIVENDVPTAVQTTVPLGTVYEDGLNNLSSIGNPEVGSTQITATITSLQLKPLVSVGADEDVTFSLNGDVGNPSGLTSHNVAVTYSVVGNTLTASAGANTVFTIVDNLDGSFTFTLKDQLDHGELDEGGGDAETLLLNLAAAFKATDFDGDSVVLNGTLSLLVENDIPKALQTTVELGTVYEDGLNNTQSVGNPESGHTQILATITSAQLKALVSAGADEDVTFSLNELVGNPAGLKSHDIAVTYSVVGNTLTASAGANTVFTIVDNLDGSFTFTLKDQLDHGPLATGGSDNETLVLNLASAFKATDFDGDSIALNGTLSLTVENDVPELTARPAGVTQTEIKETLSFDLKGGNAIVGGVSTNSTKGIWATGIDINEGDNTANTNNNNIGIGDGQSIDGQETKGNKTTGPEILTLEFFLNVDVPNNTHGAPYDVNKFRFSIDAAESQQNDDAVVFVSVLDNGNVVSPANYVITINGGTPAAANVTVHNVFNGATLIGFVFQNVPDDADFQISGNTGIVFDTVKVGNYNGFTFTSDNGGSKTVSTGNSFKVYGLEADIITIVNTLETFKISHDESPGVNTAADPNAANDVDPQLVTPPVTIAGATIGYARSTGSVTATGSLFSGKDGADEVAKYSFAITDAAGAPITNVNSGLKALDGSPILLSTDGNGVLIGSINGGATVIFKVTVDASGFVWIAQFAPIAHDLDGAGTAAHDDIATVTAALHITGTLTDFDGDKITKTSPVALKVEFQDDGPLAIDDVDSISEDGPLATGNVFTGIESAPVNSQDGNTTDGVADKAGTDGLGSVVWAGATNNGTVVAGTYGTLLVQSNGTYQYVLYTSGQNPTAFATVQGLDDGQALTEEFGYQLVDGDGDTDLATLTITITGSNDTPTITVNQGNPSGANDSTFEAALAIGSNPTSNLEFAFGTFTVGDPDGLDDLVSVTINGKTVLIANLQNAFFDGSFGTLTVTNYNASTGVASYTYELKTPTTDVPNVTEQDSFTFTVSDGTTNSASANIKIDIVDDQPQAKPDSDSVQSGATTAGNVITNAENNGDNGQDIPGADGIATIVWANAVNNTITTALGTLTIGVDGAYSYTANPNVSGIDSFSYTITDGDGDPATTTLTITVADGRPVPVAATNQTNEAALDLTQDDRPNTSLDDLAPGTKTGTNAASGDETVAGSLNLGDPNSPHVTNIAGSVSSSSVGGSAVTVEGTYGFLRIDQLGNYTYTLTKPYDTSPDMEDGAAIELARDVFTFTVTDAFNNTATSTISINIVDDVPTATQAESVSVNEGLLPSDKNPVINLPAGIAQADVGDLNINWGADDNDAKHLAFVKDGGGNPVGPSLTSDGVPLLYAIRFPIDSPGNEQIVAYKSGGDPDTDADVVFRVTLYEQGTGYYSYVQFQNIDHAAGSDLRTFTFSIKAFDGDGDSVPQTLTINVTDDTPDANDDGPYTVTEDGAGAANSASTSTVSGNVLNNDLAGADGPKTFDAWSASDPAIAQLAAYGTLTQNGNGTWSFVLNNALPATQALTSVSDLTFTLNYTVKDGDGDTSPATLKIKITGADDTATVVTAQATGADNTVFESGLNPDGSEAATGTETDTGSFSIAATDGIKEVVIGGITFNLGQIQAFDGSQTVNTGEGELTLLSYAGDSFSGSISYRYTLTATIDNDSKAGATGTGFDDVVTVTVNGIGGTTDSEDIVVHIVDDLPLAANDGPFTATEDGVGAPNSPSTSTISGDVLANDVSGADTPKAFDAWSASNVTTIADLSQYGTLTLNNDGTWSFVLNNALAATQALTSASNLTFTLNYTMKDADQDTSPATLTIKITGADDTAAVVTAEATGADNTVYESGLDAGGSEAATDLETTTPASFSISATDGIKEIVIEGITFSLTQIQAFNGSQTVDTGEGVLKLLSYSGDSFSGSVTYSYTLSATIDNDTKLEATGTGFDDSVTITVNGIGGTTDSDELVIAIVDDTPKANNDGPVIQSAANENQAVSVNVFTNDVAGADGVNLANVTSSNLSGGGSLAYDGNGTFTYTPAPGETGNVTFNYTITDGDNDPSTALVTITLAADSTPSVQTTNVTVDEDGLSGIANVDASPTLLSTETDSTESASQSGTIVVTYGKDVPANLLAAIQLSTLGLDMQLDALGGDVTWTLSADKLTLTGSVGGTPVMTIAITAANVTNATTGEVTYDYTATLLQPVTHPDNPNEDFVTLSSVTFSVADKDGTVQGGSFDVTVYDDVPEAVDNSVTQAAANENQAVSVNVFTNDVAGADGVNLANVTSSNLSGGGSLAYDGNGTFTYTPASGETGTVTFNYTIKDGDNDPSTALVTITLAADSVPTVQTTSVTVDEDGLTSVRNLDASPTLLPTETDSTESASQSGTIVVTYGKDVPANLLAAIQLSNTGLDMQLDALGGDVTWVLSNSNRTLTGSVGTTPVMTIAITAANVTNATTGEVTYNYTATLLQPVTHPGNPNEDFVTLSNIGFTVTDTDSDAQPGSFSVTVYDDVPEAVDNSVTQAAANENQAVSINVFANDVAGADGVNLANVTSSNLSGGGSLAYDGNGTFTYTPASGETGTVTFNYTIKDGDNDPSTALVTITLAADSVPTVQTTSVTVDEDGLTSVRNLDASPTLLPTETDSTESASQSGTIVVTYGKDVPANLLAAIQLSNTGLDMQLDALGGDVTWVLSNSNRTLTGSVGTTPVMTIAITAANVTNATTGEVTYNYTATLLQPVTHPGNPNEDFVTLSGVTFSVADKDGTVQAGSFDVTVYDDVPEAVNDDAISVLENAAGTIGGTLLANDALGADGATLTHIKLPGSGTFVDISTWPETVSGNGIHTITVTDVGTYTFKSDGTWTLDPVFSSSTSDHDGTFEYRIKDGDGDTSTATQPITVQNASIPFTQTANFTGIVEEEQLNSTQAVGNEDLTSTPDGDNNTATPDGDDDVSGNLTATSAVTSGNLSTMISGLDGTATYGFQVTNGSAATFVGGGEIKSHTQPVVLAVVGNTLWGFVNGGGNATEYDSVNDRPVFKVVLDTATGAFTVTLLDSIDHHLAADADNAEGIKAIDLSGLLTVTDSLEPETMVFQNVSVKVIDDVPVAKNDADSLDASAFTSASGNVVSGTGTAAGTANADGVGADGGFVSAIVSDFVGGSATTVPSGVSGATIAGHYGNLTIHQDGSYTYAVMGTGIASAATDVFTYTLKDGDGDTTTAKLTINFPTVDAPTVTLGTGDATLEDTAVTAQFTATPDSNPASTITQISISGLTGWTLGTIVLSNGAVVGSPTITAGTLTINVSGATAGTAVVASVGLTPPANSDVDAVLSMAATSTTGGVVVTSTAVNDTLFVDAVADPVTVDITVTDSNDADGSFSANELGTLNAVATFGDTGDGSETHTVTIQLQSGFLARVDGGTTLPSSGLSWTYGTQTYNYAFTYVAATGVLTVTVPNNAASATFNIGVLAPSTLPATITFDATATATETTISGGGTGASNVDLAGNNVATATDTTGIPVSRQLNATIQTNTNSSEQDMILTFIDKESPLDAYAQVILRAGTGSENAFVADAGFNIDNGSFLVGLENAIPGSKILVRDFVLEGVKIGSGNDQIDYDGNSNKDAAITATISPPTTPVAATSSIDGGQNNNTGGSSVTDPDSNVFHYLAGQEGTDTVTGSTGSDIHSGGLGTDTVNAGGGNDVIVYSPGDTMNGGGGFDILRVDQGAIYNTATFQGGSLGSPALSISSAEVTLSGTLSNIDSILLTQESTPDAARGTELNLSITEVLNMTDTDNELSIDYSTDAFTGTDKTLFVIGSQGDKLDIDTAAWTLQAGTYASPGGQVFNQYAALSGGNVLHLYVDQNIQVI